MDSEYGYYAPSPLQQRIIDLTRSLPYSWLGQRLGYALRKLVLRGHKDPFDLDVFGYRLRLYPQDNKCEKRVVCLPQFFDPEERAYLKDFTAGKNSFTFIDLGANIGLYSLFLASLDLPDFKALAIEADPEIFRRLDYNIRNNDLSITALNVAVSHIQDTITLNINQKNRGENSLTAGDTLNSSCPQIEVEAYPLLDLMDQAEIERADAMKLDLEGAEEPVLTAFFKQAPRERYPELILIENAPDRWSTDLYALIENHGYRLAKNMKANRIYKL